ncbi:MAG TPA: class I SAM-dependent methyltransferase [Acidimicrobiales bacterium]|jgi:SAM-dependent methyltransferase
MNAAHMEYCASDDWRRLVHETILPEALRGVDLGADAIEVGPGPGFTTDILCTMTARLTAVEIDEGLAGSLAERMAGANVDVVVGDASALQFPADRFSGGASFHMLHHIAPADLQDRVFSELARVLVPGAVLVGADGIYNDATAAFHEGDTYNPIDPGELGARLGRAGFVEVDVRTYDLGWVCTARAA